MFDNPYSKYQYVYQGTQYAIDVLEGRILVGSHVKKACLRFFTDLDNADAGLKKFVFDPARAERVVRFLSQLPHVKGKWRGQLLNPEPWQSFIVMNIFGWVYLPGTILDGIEVEKTIRRFRTADVFVPRKNGKSFFAGGCGLYMFAADNEHGAEVYSLATTMEQAWASWKPAKEMVGIRTTLRDKARIRTYGGDNPTAPNAAMTRPDQSIFKPLCGTPGDSASPSMAIIDEYHEWPNDHGLQTMKTGMGAREQPLLFIISTAGKNLSGPCIEEWRQCEKLLDGVIEDDTKFAIIYQLDEEDDDWAQESLRKANPNFGVSINAIGYYADQRAAAGDVRLQADFKTKYLNRWVSAAKAWLNIQDWKKCERDVKIEEFKGERCWVSADAASKIDLFCLTAIFSKDGKTYFFAKHYIPSATAEDEKNKHYRLWAERGWLTIIPGTRINASVVEAQLKEWNSMFQIQEFAYDPREMNQFALSVQTWASFPLVEINQSPASLSGAYKEFEAQVKSGTLVVQPDACLRWQASNGQLKEAQHGGPTKLYFLTKPNAASKIDAIVSGCMALARQMVGKTVDSGFHF